MGSHKHTCDNRHLPDIASCLLDQTREPYLLLDGQWCICGLSAAFAERIQIPAQAVMGLPLKKACRRFPDLAPIAAALQKALSEKGGLESTEAAVVDPRGALRLRARWFRHGTDPPARALLVNLTENPSPCPNPPVPNRRTINCLEAMMEACGVLDLDHRLVDVNQAYLVLVGYEKEALLRCSELDLTPEKWHESQKRIIEEQVIPRGYSEPFLKELRRGDGRVVPVELRLAMIREAGGRPTGMWAFVRDVNAGTASLDILHRFQHSIEISPEAVFWLDRDGRFTYVNQQACRSLGYTREELLQRCLWDVDPFFPHERWASLCKDLQENGVRLISTVHRRRDGTYFPVEVSTHPVFFGDQAHYVAYARDNTARKSADEALQFFQYAIEASPDGVFWMGRDGGFVYVNEQACRSLGYRREELLKLHLWDIDPTFPPVRWGVHWEEMRTIQSRLIETVHRRKNGSTFPIEVSAYRLPFGDEERHLAFVRDITERNRAAAALKKSEERYRRLFDNSPQPMWVVDLQTRTFVAVNHAAVHHYGYSEQAFLKMKTSDICLEAGGPPSNAAPREDARQQTHRYFQRHLLKDGTLIDVEVRAHTLTFDERRAEIVLIQDITERLRAAAEKEKLEAQLLQAQKMESIGRLAGGVAHDFNNMLGVILGYADLMRTKLAAEDPMTNDLDQLQKAALRSKEITSQLLAFSRKQVVEPRILNLNRLIRDLEKNLARLIGEDIDLLFVPFEGLATIAFDPLQIEQILMNLAVNARDAMPRGGMLTIETANVHRGQTACQDQGGLPPGDFVEVSVSDNGNGMAAETLPRIFEPFFTTKETGKGTGLGLATVYGMVKQGKGFIDVTSEPGWGTTFKIYFPMARGEEAPIEEAARQAPVAGTETLFLVEDDDMVRGIVKAMLENLGYGVLDAATPEEAMAIFSRHHSEVDLLVTDLVMPQMDGRAMYNRMQAIHPGLRVLYMSGYTADVIVVQGVLEKGVHFIAKPFSMSELARKMRSALQAG